MESFAFWYKERTDISDSKKNPCNHKSKKLAASLHFNLWCECGWSTKTKQLSGMPYPFLDIGFRITGISHAQALFFFLPFSIEGSQKEEYIEDLGKKFLENALLADALFNDNYVVTISANSKLINVRHARDKEEFQIYQLDIANDINLEPFGGGTIIEIKTERILSSKNGNMAEPEYYFRFRIKNQPLDFLIHKYNPPHGAMQLLFNTTYMIDFRFHNIRGLDNTLIERFHEKYNHTVPVRQLHFFLMTKAYVDVSNTNFRVRKIERDVWKDYVDGYDTTDLVAYHYADKAETSHNKDFLDSSELFAKFKVERQVMKKYFIFTILIGALGSILGSIICEILPDAINFLLQFLFS